jgi:dihydroorotase-like cyclic amidohydrolase
MILIKSGLLVTAKETIEGDILIEGEKIKSVGKNLLSVQTIITLDTRQRRLGARRQ